MDNIEFNKLLVKYNLLNNLEVKVIDYINDVYKLDNESLNLISIIFSYSFLGHCYTPINDLENNYKNILDCKMVQALDEKNDSIIESDFKLLKDSITTIVNAIDNFKNQVNIIGDKKIFIIKDNLIFINKYYYSSIGIKESFNRLFINYNNLDDISFDDSFIEGITLKENQKEAINRGLKSNLLLTGGPGSGKTSTIVFLLINLLKDKQKDELNRIRIHLCAPSGKAATRMNESVQGSLKGNIKDDFKNNHIDLLDKLTLLEGVTIDKLLGYTPNGYKYNKDRQIDKDYFNIFIIDEASMIDILKFNSLLNAIPSQSRVFILGDKDQLPSVENGAVFNELLKYSEYKVELKESNRFREDTDVYKLSKYINKDTNEYSFNFQNIKDFSIDSSLSHCEVQFFDDITSKKEDILEVIKKWYESYFKSIKNIILEPNELINNTYKDKLDSLNDYLNNSKILVANNNGVRGVNTINKYIKEELFKEKSDYYNGEILMICQNINELLLSNGENGICVKIKDTYYFMVQKNYENIIEGYKKEGIFKLGNFVFYPLSLIKKEYITISYAITIHKSQGSDYNNVLIILPENNNNPLLTRQIVYTAITRIKKSCYIISNKDTLNNSRDRYEERLTKIIDLK